MPSVLFVCTANICRSPMAAALFRQLLERRGERGWRVESAGTWARPGAPADRKSQAALLELELDLSGHRSRCISRELLADFDLILVMTRSHQEALRVEFPDCAAKVQLLAAMAGEGYDVADPIGGTLDDTRDSARELAALLERGLERIEHFVTAGASPSGL